MSSINPNVPCPCASPDEPEPAPAANMSMFNVRTGEKVPCYLNLPVETPGFRPVFRMKGGDVVFVREADASADDPADPPAPAPARDPRTPSHYPEPQPWQVIRAWGLGYHAGDAVAYLCRYRRKGTPLDDLKKARHHIDALIRQVEEGYDEAPGEPMVGRKIDPGPSPKLSFMYCLGAMPEPGAWKSPFVTPAPSPVGPPQGGVGGPPSADPEGDAAIDRFLAERCVMPSPQGAVAAETLRREWERWAWRNGWKGRALPHLFARLKRLGYVAIEAEGWAGGTKVEHIEIRRP